MKTVFNVETLISNSIKNLNNETKNLISLDRFIMLTIETLMNLERDSYLKELKEKNIYDKGNGHYQRSMKSLLANHLTINIPRVRNGNFTPQTLELIKHSQDQLNELSLSLYKKGMSNRDISDLLSEFFQEKMSRTTINNLAKSFHEIRVAWQNSNLDERYLAVYCDAIYITVKRGNKYSKEAVYIAYGVKENCKRELLILESSPNESATVWEDNFADLKLRGVKKIDLIIADGIKGFEDKVGIHFPDSEIQKCVLHKMKNITKKILTSDKAEICFDLKEVFNNFERSDTVENAYNKADKFVKKWQFKYPHISKYFNEKDFNYYLTYIKFNAESRRSIYTTNPIESLNSIIKKATRNKLSFESEDTLLDYLFTVIKEFQNKNWSIYPNNVFKNFCLTQTHKI